MKIVYGDGVNPMKVKDLAECLADSNPDADVWLGVRAVLESPKIEIRGRALRSIPMGPRNSMIVSVEGRQEERDDWNRRTGELEIRFRIPWTQLFVCRRRSFQ